MKARIKSTSGELCGFSVKPRSAQWRIFETWEMCASAKLHIGEHTIMRVSPGNALQ